MDDLSFKELAKKHRNVLAMLLAAKLLEGSRILLAAWEFSRLVSLFMKVQTKGKLLRSIEGRPSENLTCEGVTPLPQWSNSTVNRTPLDRSASRYILPIATSQTSPFTMSLQGKTRVR